MVQKKKKLMSNPAFVYNFHPCKFRGRISNLPGISKKSVNYRVNVGNTVTNRASMMTWAFVDFLLFNFSALSIRLRSGSRGFHCRAAFTNSRLANGLSRRTSSHDVPSHLKRAGERPYINLGKVPCDPK